jgi:hypothetical protein
VLRVVVVSRIFAQRIETSRFIPLFRREGASDSTTARTGKGSARTQQTALPVRQLPENEIAGRPAKCVTCACGRREARPLPFHLPAPFRHLRLFHSRNYYCRSLAIRCCLLRMNRDSAHGERTRHRKIQVTLPLGAMLSLLEHLRLFRCVRPKEMLPVGARNIVPAPARTAIRFWFFPRSNSQQRRAAGLGGDEHSREPHCRICNAACASGLWFLVGASAGYIAAKR